MNKADIVAILKWEEICDKDKKKQAEEQRESFKN